jgi:hypothetical protein
VAGVVAVAAGVVAWAEIVLIVELPLGQICLCPPRVGIVVAVIVVFLSIASISNTTNWNATVSCAWCFAYNYDVLAAMLC